MNKRILILVAIFLTLSISFNKKGMGQTSVASIGRAITQCNDFNYAKLLLTGDGLIYDETKSNKSLARFYKPAKSINDALFVYVYKSKEGVKIEKCVVIVLNDYLSELRALGYEYVDPKGLSIEPFEALYESGKYAVGLNRNKRGWLVVTFFRWDQDVEFEHLLEK